jgi:hypothetical protein
MSGHQTRPGRLREEINLLNLLGFEIIIIIIILIIIIISSSSSSSSSTVIVVEVVQVVVVVVDAQSCPSVEPNSEHASQLLNMRTERDPFSEIRLDVQKPSNPKCNVPPSETFRIVKSKFF